MPELPEVETLCRQLQMVLPGLTIGDIRILDPRLEEPVCTGLVVKSVSRRGKYIRMILQNKDGSIKGTARRMGDGILEALLHLRMTGRLCWLAEEAPLPAHTRMVIFFPGGKLLLIDPRRFATFTIRPLAEGGLPVMDPLEEGMSAEALRRQAGVRRLSVKAFLMDQRFIAGIGNIYACEILHMAGIDPHRQARALRKPEWAKVAASSRTILLRAIACRGTSISDWRDLFGMPGENQRHLRVYAREGLPCFACGSAIIRTRLNGRGTWYCPVCQT